LIIYNSTAALQSLQTRHILPLTTGKALTVPIPCYRASNMLSLINLSLRQPTTRQWPRLASSLRLPVQKSIQRISMQLGRLTCLTSNWRDPGGRQRHCWIHLKLATAMPVPRCGGLAVTAKITQTKPCLATVSFKVGAGLLSILLIDF
jgi:hypothetical protein